jgi:hypothetical protein
MNTICPWRFNNTWSSYLFLLGQYQFKEKNASKLEEKAKLCIYRYMCIYLYLPLNFEILTSFLNPLFIKKNSSFSALTHKYKKNALKFNLISRLLS